MAALLFFPINPPHKKSTQKHMCKGGLKHYAAMLIYKKTNTNPLLTPAMAINLPLLYLKSTLLHYVYIENFCLI